ncbi:hypothetical protein D3C75_1176320 [compost metagenome]
MVWNAHVLERRAGNLQFGHGTLALQFRGGLHCKRLYAPLAVANEVHQEVDGHDNRNFRMRIDRMLQTESASDL